jgi:hypothetical protein
VQWKAIEPGQQVQCDLFELLSWFLRMLL